MGKRYIKLYEQILNWEWFCDPNTLQLFLYLLLKANYKDSSFQGVDVKRGQIVTSLSKLGQATGQTIRMVRDNLKHLEMTGEVTSQSTNRYRIITIVRYDEYQSSDKQNDKQMTNEVTSELTSKAANKTATSIEYIEHKENKELKNKTPSVFVPPTLDEVTEYCRERGNRVDPEKWFDFYASKGWMIGKNKMKDWKAAVRTWEKDVTGKWPPKTATTAPAQKYEQRDYASEQDAAVDRMMNSDWGSW